MRRLLRTAAPALVLLLPLTACGGGGDDGAKKNVAAAQAADDTTTNGSPDVTQEGILAAAGLTQQCLDYGAYAGAVGLAMAAAMDPSAAAGLEELKSKMKLDDAPEEIRDDFAVVMDYAEGLGAVMARYNVKAGEYNAEAMTAIAGYAESVDQARMQEAGTNINAWLGANCQK